MGERYSILVVDDEPGIREMLTYGLSQEYLVETASNGVEALEKIAEGRYHVVISDIKMPRMDGLQLLERIKKVSPDTEVIVSTAYGTIETAVGAMKNGAYDFIQKPFNLDEAAQLVKKALEKSELRALLGVYEASKAVFSSVKLEELLPVLGKLAAQVLKADDASIMLLDASGRLSVAASFGLDDAKLAEARLALGERVAGRVARDAAPAIVDGPLEKDPRFSGVASLREIRSAIVFPLNIGGRLLGVMNVSRTRIEEPFGPADLRNATIFCSQIAQAIHNAELYRALDDKIREVEGMQAQLIQSEKLAAVGQLAAGVAHEINNPLGGIMGFAELLLSGGGLNVRQREDVESIIHESRRCQAITRSLLQFSRRKHEKMEPLDLKTVLSLVLQLASYELRRSGVDVAADLPDGLPRIKGSAAQLEQVFLNIITNARQAMEGGSRRGKLLVTAAAESGSVVVSFADNGCGIDPGDLKKIFDPFFTTKPTGTGLGLSISYGIIKQHNGEISAESVPGRGSAFKVRLPQGKI